MNKKSFKSRRKRRNKKPKLKRKHNNWVNLKKKRKRIRMMRMMMKNLKKSLRKNQRSIIKRKTKKPKPKSRRNQVKLKKRIVNRKHKKAHFRIKVWQKLLKACKPSWKLTTRNGRRSSRKRWAITNSKWVKLRRDSKRISRREISNTRMIPCSWMKNIKKNLTEAIKSIQNSKRRTTGKCMTFSKTSARSNSSRKWDSLKSSGTSRSQWRREKKIAAAMANATKAWVSDGDKIEWTRIMT